ncbi:putative Zinc finger, BED-type [Corchorus capsularis]|uniref:Putative Zinc finger, BED-type n=1 Tax=Corchorus capsularis TaxID=210143 RepID=A0A1R3IS61_COCAP|nr:putative Zinc finger, BED-type [Corchorus capsularis]
MESENININLESTNNTPLEAEPLMLHIHDDDDGDEVEEVKDGSSSTRKRRRTSNVCSVFKDTKEKAPDGKPIAKCKWCGKQQKYNSKYGTGNLKCHVETCVKRDTKDVGQMIIDVKDKSITVRSSKFDPLKLRELAIAAIVMHNLPLAFVEYKGVRAILSYCLDGRDVGLVSRNTAKSDLLKLHAREKGRVKSLLEDVPGRISLTSDLWTSVVTDGYICLTAHFVDKAWNLQKRVLNFSFMPPPHTGVALSEKVYNLIDDWKIDRKLFSITLDNASSNDTFVDFLKIQLTTRHALLKDGEFFHIRCCAHILNLIVQDGLKEVDKAIIKVRESIKYVKGSQGRKQKFLECVNLVSLNSKKGLRQDVPTRWNSTFLMLQGAIYFRKAFSHLEINDSNYRHCPSKDEWDRIEKLCTFLSDFYDVTYVFSGTKYPTSNLYFPAIYPVRVSLQVHLNGTDEFMKDMAARMFTKFEKYWKDFSIILAIACVLDPRYKLSYVEWVYKKLFGANSDEFKKVKETLFSLYDEYAKDVGVTSNPSPTLDFNDFGDGNSKGSTRLTCEKILKKQLCVI